MSYKGKVPHQYDRNGRRWKEGAYFNWRLTGNAEGSAAIDRSVLGARTTRYHQFTEPYQHRAFPKFELA